jgi:2-iminoacetate synthase ThiH
LISANYQKKKKKKKKLHIAQTVISILNKSNPFQSFIDNQFIPKKKKKKKKRNMNFKKIFDAMRTAKVARIFSLNVLIKPNFP